MVDAATLRWGQAPTRWRGCLILVTVGAFVACGGIEERDHPVPCGGGGGGFGGIDAACTGGSPATSTGGSSGLGGSMPDGIDANDGPTSRVPTGLLGAPLSFSPTAHGFGLSAVATDGDPSLLLARTRPAGTALWSAPSMATVRDVDVGQWWFDGLTAGTRYEYQVMAADAGSQALLYSGTVVTQRPAGDSFTFAFITDSHIGSDLSYDNQGDPTVLAAVSAEVDAAAPDFVLHLGDMLDFHEYGFNAPPPAASITRAAYLNYRTLLGSTLGHAAHFLTIGNWEGEDGTYTAEEIERSLSQRLLYVPGPAPSTYPESGSPNQDYYAFTWGDALFVVLNVMTHTTTPHLLSNNPGLPDDWTLGTAQLAWLETTLANATSRWRFLCIHHPVGGAAGDAANSGYGRGGGQAAYVGEQATVHRLMLQYGAQIFFYGHDHVFADLQVDGIHYTLPGNAGAIWMFTKSQTGYAPSQSWLEYGWTKVTVSPVQAHVEFVKMGGQLLYEYTLPGSVDAG